MTGVGEPAWRQAIDGARLPPDTPLAVRESYSSLTTYESCPRRYAYRYVERLTGEVPPGRYAYGRAVHRAFEVFIGARILARREGAPEPDQGLLASACDDSLADAGMEPDELARMRADAGPALARFLARERALTTVPVAVELGFGMEVPIPGGDPVRFVGYLDRVDLAADGSLVITDYKGGLSATQEQADRHPQLTAYAWAAERGALRDPGTGAVLPPAGRLCLYYTEDGVELSTTRSSEQLAAFGRALTVMVTSVRQREFDPRPGRWSCRWCEYRSVCPSALDG